METVLRPEGFVEDLPKAGMDANAADVSVGDVGAEDGEEVMPENQARNEWGLDIPGEAGGYSKWREKLAAARAAHNTLDAIRVKRAAELEGIMLSD